MNSGAWAFLFVIGAIIALIVYIATSGRREAQINRMIYEFKEEEYKFRKNMLLIDPTLTEDDIRLLMRDRTLDELKAENLKAEKYNKSMTKA